MTPVVLLDYFWNTTKHMYKISWIHIFVLNCFRDIWYGVHNQKENEEEPEQGVRGVMENPNVICLNLVVLIWVFWGNYVNVTAVDTLALCVHHVNSSHGVGYVGYRALSSMRKISAWASSLSRNATKQIGFLKTRLLVIKCEAFVFRIKDA